MKQEKASAHRPLVQKWVIWIKNRAVLEKDFKNYLKRETIREDATYSISVEYERGLAENLGDKAIEFVNKVERVLRGE